MSDLWHTTLSAIQRGEPDWQAIAAYEAPVRRYLARRYRTLPASERDDLLQEVLLAMRERVVPGYRVEVGSFRGFLAISIQNAVRDHLRRQRPSRDLASEEHRLESPPEHALSPEEAAALDLEARLLRSVRTVHDRYARGPDADLRMVYVLSGALVDKLSNKDLANREGLSVDQVKRILQRAREEILQDLFLSLLPGLAPAEAARCAELTRRCLRHPRKQGRLLEASSHGELIATLLAALRSTREVFQGSAEQDGLDLVAGIQAIFQ